MRNEAARGHYNLLANGRVLLGDAVHRRRGKGKHEQDGENIPSKTPGNL